MLQLSPPSLKAVPPALTIYGVKQSQNLEMPKPNEFPYCNWKVLDMAPSAAEFKKHCLLNNICINQKYCTTRMVSTNGKVGVKSSEPEIQLPKPKWKCCIGVDTEFFVNLGNLVALHSHYSCNTWLFVL